MKPSAMGTIAVHTELVITPKLAPSLRVTTVSKRTDALVARRPPRGDPGACGGRPAGSGRAPRTRPTTATAAAPHTATERHRTRWPSSTAAVTPTAGTKASTPPTSEPQIGIPSITMATHAARRRPTAVPMLRPPSRRDSSPHRRKAAPANCP